MSKPMREGFLGDEEAKTVGRILEEEEGQERTGPRCAGKTAARVTDPPAAQNLRVAAEGRHERKFMVN